VATLEERTAAANPPVRQYTAELVRGVTAHVTEIDARISACLAPGWTLPRILEWIAMCSGSRCTRSTTARFPTP
jgi:hypothetical protein